MHKVCVQFFLMTILLTVAGNRASAGDCVVSIELQEPHYAIFHKTTAAFVRQFKDSSLPACLKETANAYEGMLGQLNGESQLVSKSYYSTESQSTDITIHPVLTAKKTYTWSFGIANEAKLVAGNCFGVMGASGQTKGHIGRAAPYSDLVRHFHFTNLEKTDVLSCTRSVLAEWNRLSLMEEVGIAHRSSYLFHYNGRAELYSIEADMKSMITPVPLTEWTRQLGF